MKTPMRCKRIYLGRQKNDVRTNPLLRGYDLPSREFRCSRCSTRFPDYLARCPECGSEDWEELAEVNPYTRLPLESFLKGCGHAFWILGVLAFLVLLWLTDTPSPEMGRLFIYGAVCFLVLGTLFSALFFGLSEILRRILRMQRRLRAFHDTYRLTRVITMGTRLSKKMPAGRP